MAPKNVGEEQEQQERELGIPPVVTPPSEDANNPVIQDGSVCIFNGLIESLPEPPSGRVLYLTRHGESMYNLDQRIGGNPSLSPRGIKYATCLSHHVNNMQIPGLKVITITLINVFFF